MSDALSALRAVDFSAVRSLESIWSDAEFTVSGPNDGLVDATVGGFIRAAKPNAANPPGQFLVGQAGIGKTHVVGNLRRKTWEAGGWFVLLDVIGITDFWKSTALSFLTSLLQQMPDGRAQHEAVFSQVARRLGVESQVQAAFDSPGIQPQRIVDILVKGLMKIDAANALRHQDVFRALALLRAHDAGLMSFAHGWLQGYDADDEKRKTLGFHAQPPAPVELVRGMSWIMSLTGPTLIAVDQIDGVVNPSSMAIHGGNMDAGADQSLSELLAAGLMELWQVAHRSKTIVTCLFDSWKIIEAKAIGSMWGRFDTSPVPLGGLGQKTAVEALIVSRLQPAYAAEKFKPDFPSWPFSRAALEGASAAGLTPRVILMRCDAFRRECLDKKLITICDSLMAKEPLVESSIAEIVENPFSSELKTAFDQASIEGLVQKSDDGEIGNLLRHAFDLYARQFEPNEAVDVVSKGDPAQKTPPLHGRLTFTFHDENDRERHYCYRALEHENAISFQSRLKAALTASGIAQNIADRHLLLVRQGPIPGGVKTKQLFDLFLAAGGIVIKPSEDDLRNFVALRDMQAKALAEGRQEKFDSWLRSRKPLCETAFFQAAGLSPPPDLSGSGRADPIPVADEPPSAPLPDERPTKTGSMPVKAPPVAPPPQAPTSIPVGRRMTMGAEPVDLPIKLLARHTAIIAGSGSGKTVLLRRLVEEAALAGVPAIVIDPNNDLSRLGDAWPERPDTFTAEDDAKVAAYRKNVEVVVWTPGLYAGNPIFLPVLPDFSALGDDQDERQQAVDMAAETLQPLAGAKTNLQKGVLADALRAFAEKGGGDLRDLTQFLADLPDRVSAIGKAAQLAAHMADELLAAVATNPLLKSDGPVLDPARLFFGANLQRTRISVINLSGLTSHAAREDFVNRLQMTLFSWIKKHPSPTGLLYVIDEAQNFLPSMAPALSKGSGVQLVAQARKYGLGMIVATQAPKGIDNRVVSNCTTQFFGKQNSPVTINAARDIIAASGGHADDIGKLKAGEFYFATEGFGKPGKIRTSICLSYHPSNPPTPDEVVARAKKSAG